MKQSKKLLWLFSCLIFIAVGVLRIPQNEASASTKTITAGMWDTTSVLDMKSSSFKNLTASSSTRSLIVSINPYKVGNTNYTSVLVHSPAGVKTGTITISYYDISKKKTCTTKIKTTFIEEYNGGFSTSQTFKKDEKKTYKIKSSAAIDSIDSSFLNYNHTSFQKDLADKTSPICTVKSNKVSKEFSITATKYGMTDCTVDVNFINGAIQKYILNVNVPEKSGIINSVDLKVVKNELAILYYYQPQKGKISIKISDEDIVDAILTEKEDSLISTLKIKGLKNGKTSIYVIFKEQDKTITNRYNIDVISSDPNQQEINVAPEEIEHMYSCFYPMVDAYGNSLILPVSYSDYFNNQLIELTPNSNEVTVNDSTFFGLSFTAEGTYQIDVALKDLDGSIIERYSLKINANDLKYSDYEEIALKTEKEALTFFCGSDNNDTIWRDGRRSYGLAFHSDGTMDDPWDGDTWLFGEGYERIPYTIDIKKQIIMISNPDETIIIKYKIISKNHARFTVRGVSLEFFRSTW